MTKAAPITAATTCATSRVRFAPMTRNSATRKADRQRGRGGAHGDNQPIGAHPAPAAARDQYIDERRRERQRHHRHRQRHRGDAHGEDLFRRGRRSQDEIEIGPRIEGARRQFHRLRDHQQPRQQHASGDRDQRRLIGRGVGIAADHPIGDEMHEDDEDRDGDDDAAQALAPAAAHHGEPVAPGETPLVPGKPDGAAGLCDHAASAGSATSARKVSSRLALSLAAAPDVSCLAGLEPQLFERAFGDELAVGDDADAVGHALGDFKNVRGHDDGAAGANALAQNAFDLARGAGVEPGQRLVENDQPRLVNERAGERHFLPHALGETLAAFLRMRREFEPVQKFLRARLRQAPARGPTVRRRIRDIPAA